MIQRSHSALILFLAWMSLHAGVTRQAPSLRLQEINPLNSNLSAGAGGSGGRIHGLARADALTYYAASEWGGLFKTTDGGLSWFTLGAHLPAATWDVAVDPRDTNTVYASSSYDGRTVALGGINISHDGGRTWTHAEPDKSTASPCKSGSFLSAFGISVDPENASSVFVGTSCGLAASFDSGTTWKVVGPAGLTALAVWDVVAHDKKIVDACGDAGHLRSVDAGQNWTRGSMPSGKCTLAVAPGGRAVFATIAAVVYQSSDGQRWSKITRAPVDRPGRMTYLATNSRAPGTFDLWFGAAGLYRTTCRWSPSQGRENCDGSWTSSMTSPNGAHDDVGALAFGKSEIGGACPTILGTDGGIYVNASQGDCQIPRWRAPDAAPRGLWVVALSAVSGSSQADDRLSFGTQDNGLFTSVDGGASWNNADCCDVFDVSADASSLLYSRCCDSPPPRSRLRLIKGAGGHTAEVGRPYGELGGRRTALDTIDRFADSMRVVVTARGVYTSDFADPVPIWTERGWRPADGAPCGVRAAGTKEDPVFVVQTVDCAGRSGNGRLWRYSKHEWRRLASPGRPFGFGVFAISQQNPDVMVAAVPTSEQPATIGVYESRDGGGNWSPLSSLDPYMAGGSPPRFKSWVATGQSEMARFEGYWQPSLLAIDPKNGQTMLAGGMEAGLFLSRDAGTSWIVITDNSSAMSPIVPRPLVAAFTHHGAKTTIYVGTQGRGIWRISD